MRRAKRSQLQIDAANRTNDEVRRMGALIRAARRRRCWTQATLAERATLSRGMVSRAELGNGEGLAVGSWFLLCLALDMSPRFVLSRDPKDEPTDAGHLGIQELLLRIGRSTGYPGMFELAVKPSDPTRSIDVCLRNDAARRLLFLEAFNRLDDIGAAARSFDRKMASASEVAAWIGGGGYTVRGAWVLRATRRNRELVAKYPEVFAAKFPGSSRKWVEALMTGSEPPEEPGLMWCDVAGTRLFAWRRSTP